MIKSRNIDPEAGRWSEPLKLASSVTASFAFKNPTAHTIFIDKIIVNVTTAAASKTLYAGASASATATNATNELLNGASLVSSQVLSGVGETTIAKGSYLVGTLNATDATLDAYAYVHFKELIK